MGSTVSIPKVYIPASTLPEGWVSWYDKKSTTLFYIHSSAPKTKKPNHPLGSKAHNQELARFHAIRSLFKTSYRNVQAYRDSNFEKLYNQQGGFSASSEIIKEGFKRSKKYSKYTTNDKPVTTTTTAQQPTAVAPPTTTTNNSANRHHSIAEENSYELMKELERYLIWDSLMDMALRHNYSFSDSDIHDFDLPCWGSGGGDWDTGDVDGDCCDTDCC